MVLHTRIPSVKELNLQNHAALNVIWYDQTNEDLQELVRMYATFDYWNMTD